MNRSPVSEAGDDWSLFDDREKQFRLWFFRDLSDEQRLSLFRLTGAPVDGMLSLGHQRLVLDRMLSRRSLDNVDGVERKHSDNCGCGYCT